MVKQIVKTDKKLLELLVCPITKQPLIYDKKKKQLISKSASIAYSISEGIPIMLAQEATPIKK